MIDLYTFTTPNGRKIPIALEELGLPYTVHVIDITKGDQKQPEYLKINPNGKIPAIVDQDGPGGRPLAVFESGAILIYLAEKTGKLLPKDAGGRAQVIAWLMFQMSAVGPMFGQYNHFFKYAKEKVPYALERYKTESERILSVLESQLSKQEFLGPDFSIADIATYTWVVAAKDFLPEALARSPGLNRWLERVGARPAVKKGMTVPELKK